MGDLRQELIKLGTLFYQRNWLPATHGNLSARLEDGSWWTIAANSPRRNLRPEDFIRIDADGKVAEASHPTDTPTQETPVHEALYQVFPRVAACYQLYMVEAYLVSNMGDRVFLLPPLELLRHLGVGQGQERIELPIFENSSDASAVAKNICRRFRSKPPTIPVLLIRNNSLVVWASSMANALNYVEVIDHVLCYVVAARRLGL